MARFRGLFKKDPEDEDSYEPYERRPRARKLKGEYDEDSGIDEALDEIESEEELPELEDIEDELIELEGTTGIASSEASGELFGQLTEKLNEVDAKMGRIDMVISTIKNESTQFQDQIGQLEEDMRKLLSVYEVVSARFNPFIDMNEEAREFPEAELPEDLKPEPHPVVSKKEDEEMATVEDIPPFRPYGHGKPDRTPTEGKFFGREGAESETPWEPKLSTLAVERQGADFPEPSEEAQSPERFKTESPLGREPPTVKGKTPILTHISHDYLTLVLVMRWIEFLFERTTRDKISLVLDYYKDIGWISEDVKSEIMAYARGEMQDVMKYMAHEEARDDALGGDVPTSLSYKKVDDWRLSAEDHLKSLLFVMKIANKNVDKDRLNSLEQMIQKFKESLEGFHGV